MNLQTSDLSANRLEVKVYPLHNCVVDDFGPFQVKHIQKSVKKWVCLFTCLSTRGINLQNVSSLDMQSCLDAIYRYVARRRCPKTNLSDNGTNFVGATREFRELFSALKGTQLDRDAAKFGINWTFKLPGEPHFDGVWENLVRSCKKAMRTFLVLNG